MEEHDDRLREIPYSERAVLLPQCLRSNHCRAPTQKHGIIHCERCGQKRDDGIECPVPAMIKIAEDIGYRKVFVLLGGSGIESYFREKERPAAVLGVACTREVELAMPLMKSLGIVSQAKYLKHDGCSETMPFNQPSDWRREWTEFLTRRPPKASGP